MRSTNEMSADISSPAVDMRTKLSIENVSMGFDRDGQPIQVLENINLEIREGEFICLLGPSGCGKSTLLSAIGGFFVPTSGVVRIDGKVVHAPDPRRIFVFQERGVFPWLTVEGNVAFGLANLPRSSREVRVRKIVPA
jgi:NitT/TauT family transport system ATP-binding protein